MHDKPFTQHIRDLQPEMFERLERLCERYRRDEDLRMGMELYRRPLVIHSFERVAERTEAA